ncbi:MAG: response regulator [Pseudomonadota bacterium]
MPLRIAAVDDNPMDLAWLKRLAFQQMPTAVTFDGFAEIEHTLEVVARGDISLLLLDDHLGHGDALTNLKLVQDLGTDTQVVVVTGELPPGRRERLLKLGAMEVLSKDDLTAAIFADLIAMALAKSSVFRRAPTTRRPMPEAIDLL